MTFQMIPNPLGSGGYNVQPLPDMTGGIQALQKVEIQRRINEIEKEKDYKNNVNLLMEKKALDLLMPKAYEGIAGQTHQDYLKAAGEYKKYAADTYRRIHETGGGRWDEGALYDMGQKFNEVSSIVNQGKIARESFDIFQKQAIDTLSKITNPKQREQVLGQIASLSDEYKQGNIPSPYRIAEALYPGDNPSYEIYNDVEKELMPKLSHVVESAGGGKTRINEAEAIGITKKHIMLIIRVLI